MCFAKPKVDTSIQKQQSREAQEARAQEEARQARIRAGSAKVDQTFAGFDDNWFSGKRQEHMDFYQPQLDDQFKDANEQLIYALSRAGTLNSSIAADKQADLSKRYDLQKATILSQANDSSNQMRGQVQGEKSNLLAQLNATGDADRVSNDALSRSQQLFQAAPSYNPLGDIFAGVSAGIGNAAAAGQSRNQFNTYFGNRSAGRVIG